MLNHLTGFPNRLILGYLSTNFRTLPTGSTSSNDHGQGKKGKHLFLHVYTQIK
jgi:hypothetical protein